MLQSCTDFLLAGGYVYFKKEEGSDLALVQLNALSLTPARCKIHLEKTTYRPRPETMLYLRKQGRFSKVASISFKRPYPILELDFATCPSSCA